MTTHPDSSWPPGDGPLPQLPWARLLLADNPGPMTLTGTNTWLLADPATWAAAAPDPEAALLIIDPGPATDSHLAQLRRLLDAFPRAEMLVTHRHHDHTDALQPLADSHPDVPCHAATARFCRHTQPQIVGPLDMHTPLPGFSIQVVHTPGHTDDSISLVVTSPDKRRAVLSGDTVLGQGSSVVAHPDGNVADYLTSLGALLGALLAPEHSGSGPAGLLPGHGPAQPDAAVTISQYTTHRVQRLAQVRDALQGTPASDADVDDLTKQVYPQVPPKLHAAARASVLAHLQYLAAAEQPQ